MSGIIQRWAVVCFFIAALAMVVRVGDEPAPDRLNLVAAGACDPGGGTTTTQSTTSSSSTTAATTTAGGSTTTGGGSTTTKPAATTSKATTTTAGGSTLPGGITLPIGGTTSTSSTSTTAGGSTTSKATTTTAGGTLPGGITIPFPRAAGGNAAAAAGECDSDVTIKYGNGEFSGKVTSKSSKCKRGRTVEVEKVSGQNDEVGETKTNSRGKYKINYPKKKAMGETFEVRIFKERKGGVRCGAARDKVKP